MRVCACWCVCVRVRVRDVLENARAGASVCAYVRVHAWVSTCARACVRTRVCVCCKGAMEKIQWRAGTVRSYRVR